MEDDAIDRYVKFMDGGAAGTATANEVRTKAKEQLLSSGWTFWMATKYDGRQELRYKAPQGRSYNSLIVACRAYQKIDKTRLLRAPPPPIATTPDDDDDSKIKTAACSRIPPSNKIKNSSSGKKKAADSSSRNSSSFKINKMVTADSNSRKKRTTTADSNSRKKRRTTRTETADDYDHHAAARVLRPRSADAIVVSSCAANGSPPDSESDSDAGDPPYVADGCTRSKRRRRVSALHAIKKPTNKKEASTSPAPAASNAKARVLMLQDGGANRDRGGVRVKRRLSDKRVENDSVCSACADVGGIVLCDQCPASFHPACVGLDLDATPAGDWFCPSCRCAICGTSELDDDDAATGFTDKTVIYCDQCERQYHVGCVRNSGQPEPVAGQVQAWVCSDDCAEVREHLQSLVGRSTPTSVPGVSFMVVRGSSSSSPETKKKKKKLRAAYSVLHECFMTLTEPRTRSNTTKDMLHNRWSADGLRRLDFRGFYVVGLEEDKGELVTVGTLRVYGKEVAELPLVGTRVARRRRGMCRVLMAEVESALRSVGVERLVLPAVEELLETWTGSFGFEVMPAEEKVEMARRHALLCFQGTTVCRKYLT